MSIFPVCHLHVGIAKTGSTSIQAFLSENRNALVEAGFYYPQAFWLPNQVGLMVYARKAPVVEILTRRRNLTTQAQVEQYREQVKIDFLAEAEALRGRGLSLLLSNEHLHSRLQEVGELERLRDLLAPVCAQIKIIVYLRRQDRVAVSLLATMMKTGTSKVPTGFPDADARTRHYYDYADLLRRYSQVFGAANCVVRVFEPASLLNGDVVDDYCATVGLPPSPSFRRPVSRNTSINPFGLRLLAEMNKHIPLFAGNQANPLRGDLSRAIEVLYPGKSVLASRAEAIAFAAIFAAGNREVKRQFLPTAPGDSLFDEDFSLYEETSAAASLSFEEGCEAAARLWKYQSEQLERLRSRLEPGARRRPKPPDPEATGA